MAESPQIVRRGSCYCGDVSYEVKGNPLFSVYCHCTQCQRSFGAVFVNAIHFTPAAFSWTFSAENNPEAEAQEGCTVYRCKKCRGAPATQMSDTQNWALRGTQLERDEDGRIKQWEDVIAERSYLVFQKGGGCRRLLCPSGQDSLMRRRDWVEFSFW
ncbi:Mss4-like protein [Favolaschia claudopus]|uniref:Mss4-like protein n=1 Tax=Favolaschia claudopus TaxID=2862362 RepID=A0AAW0EE16_9AGAR